LTLLLVVALAPFCGVLPCLAVAIVLALHCIALPCVTRLHRSAANRDALRSSFAPVLTQTASFRDDSQFHPFKSPHENQIESVSLTLLTVLAIILTASQQVRSRDWSFWVFGVLLEPASLLVLVAPVLLGVRAASSVGLALRRQRTTFYSCKPDPLNLLLRSPLSATQPFSVGVETVVSIIVTVPIAAFVVYTVRTRLLKRQGTSHIIFLLSFPCCHCTFLCFLLRSVLDSTCSNMLPSA
jgi:hypothetical protein